MPQPDPFSSTDAFDEYVGAYKEIGAAYREIVGRHFPAMTAVQVVELIEDQARVEIECTAVIPP